ncbi:hypothetical protein HK405_009122 [Cladochytrium tenue]|nr:hypothetical protein HK405_009122 [Cladochytrium tenue]
MPQHLYLSLYLALSGDKSPYEVLEELSEGQQFSLPIDVPQKYKNFISPGNTKHPKYQILRCEAQAAFQEDEKWAKSLSEAVRKSRQTSGAVFGLDASLYPSITASDWNSPFIVQSLMRMLRAPVNPVDLVKDSKRGQLQRMLYMSDPAKIDKVEGPAFASPDKTDNVDRQD